MKKLKVLVACEESQTVCSAFRELGHEAYSCDIIECSGGHPEWHIQQDVLPLLNGNCEFTTCLWLKGLPQLMPTNIVDCGEVFEYKGKNGNIKKYPKWMMDALRYGTKDRQKIRSKTFDGIAKAMAEQWSKQ